MVNCQIDKVKTEKDLESISEIFWTLQNHYECARNSKLGFFINDSSSQMCKVSSHMVKFATFKKVEESQEP